MLKSETQNKDQNEKQESGDNDQEDRSDQFARKEIVEQEKGMAIEEIYKKQLQTFQKPPKASLRILLIGIFISLVIGIIIGFFAAYLLKIQVFSLK